MTRPALFDFESFGDAEAAAGAGKKLLLVDFTATWCPPCRAMEAGAWKDPRVESWVREHAHAVQVDIDANQALSQRFNVRAVPTVIALRAGAEVDRFTGGRPADAVLEFFRGLEKGETELDRMQREAQGGDLHARFTYANALASAGRLDDASKELLWLWEHALEIEPAWVGVRHSYLLGGLAELSRMHPPTRVELQRLRDAAEAGNRRDWLSLNQALGDIDRSLAWFDQVKLTMKPDELGGLQNAFEEPLVERERWTDLALLFPDPVAAFEQRRQLSAQMMNDSIPEEMREQLREYIATSLRERVEMLVRAHTAAGHADLAEQLELHAKDFLKNDGPRS
jgi:thiol-disulfide isomerase/thioredoxin